MMRADEALAGLRRRLAPVSPCAALDAELLLAHVLGLGRAALAADPHRLLTPAQSETLAALAARRADGEPVAYLIGRREFWSLDLEVTADVLVPRPETELLVELALESLAGVARPAVLDLGTGSGAIALAIAIERPDATVTAVDASAAALTVAGRNAAQCGLRNVRFLEGSWFEPVAGIPFDAIVSNPPYLGADDPALVSLAHEPRAALVAGPGGLEALSVICAGAHSHLAHGGQLIVEHGASQGAAVRALMTGAGFSAIASHRDLAGHERSTRGRCARH